MGWLMTCAGWLQIPGTHQASSMKQSLWHPGLSHWVTVADLQPVLRCVFSRRIPPLTIPFPAKRYDDF
jgi:hypothetical protein